MRYLHPRLVLKFLLVILAVWIAFDLFVPHHSSFKKYDSNVVAKLETDMWRSYYERKPFQLFWQLTKLLRTQYHLPFLKSNYVSYEATRAAFVFKKGHNRNDYEKALPYLVKYYRSIRNAGDVPFSVERAAKLELEWWIVHRERNQHPPSDLVNALADIQSELYQAPAQKFTEHADYRAQAMTLRDDLAEKGDVSDKDWQRINDLLVISWKSHHETLNQM
jgi:hypothetical protein